MAPSCLRQQRPLEKKNRRLKTRAFGEYFLVSFFFQRACMRISAPARLRACVRFYHHNQCIFFFRIVSVAYQYISRLFFSFNFLFSFIPSQRCSASHIGVASHTKQLCAVREDLVQQDGSANSRATGRSGQSASAPCRGAEQLKNKQTEEWKQGAAQGETK